MDETHTPDEATSMILSQLPGDISQAQMRHYLSTGAATPLSRIITEFIKYDGHWWTTDLEAWFIIEDPTFAARLDNHSTWANAGLYIDTPTS